MDRGAWRTTVHVAAKSCELLIWIISMKVIAEFFKYKDYYKNYMCIYLFSCPSTMGGDFSHSRNVKSLLCDFLWPVEFSGLEMCHNNRRC